MMSQDDIVGRSKHYRVVGKYVSEAYCGRSHILLPENFLGGHRRKERSAGVNAIV